MYFLICNAKDNNDNILLKNTHIYDWCEIYLIYAYTNHKTENKLRAVEIDKFPGYLHMFPGPDKGAFPGDSERIT